MLRLRTRLLLTYLATLIPLAVGFGWWAFTVARAGLESELGRGLATAASVIAADINASSAAGRIARLEPDSDATRERLRADLAAVQSGATLARVRVVDAELRTLLDTADTAPFATAFDLDGDRFEIDRVLEDRQPRSSVLFYGTDGSPYKRGYATVVLDGEPFALVVVERPAEYFDLLHAFRAQVAAFGLALLALIVIVTVWTSRRITRPLSSLSAAAAHIGAGDFDTSIPEAGADEIGALSRALQRMQAGLAARQEESQMMLAGIAHEVRNPLGGMELFVGLLEESLDTDSEEAEYASKVRRELNYLSRVVEEFLLFARDRPMEWVKAPAAALLESVREGARSLTERGVTMDITIDPGAAEITADTDALRGVLINLVQNAAQASERGQTVDVRVSAARGERVVSIADHGRGMSPEVLTEVFRPFYTTREKGTGLGLPLAKRIIERHAGTLAIESDVGVGTRVTITLPFRANAPATPQTGPGGLDDSDWDGEMIG